MLLDGLVDKTTYTNTLAEIETSISENEHLLEKYQENNVDIADSISNIIEFAGNLRKIIESSRMQDRREIFGIILSNSVINERKAWFCLKKRVRLIAEIERISNLAQRVEHWSCKVSIRFT